MYSRDDEKRFKNKIGDKKKKYRLLSCCMNVDENGLYGHCMTLNMPIGGVKLYDPVSFLKSVNCESYDDWVSMIDDFEKGEIGHYFKIVVDCNEVKDTLKLRNYEIANPVLKYTKASPDELSLYNVYVNKKPYARPKNGAVYKPVTSEDRLMKTMHTDVVFCYGNVLKFLIEQCGVKVVVLKHYTYI